MTRYIGARLLIAIPTLIGVFIAVFFIVRLVPGDPAVIMLGNEATPEQIEMFREQNGLNEQPIVQVGVAIQKFATGDFGESLASRQPVFNLIMEKFPRTLELALWSILLNSIIGITLGTIAAVKRGKWQDYTVTGLSTLGMSMPSFFVALIVLMVLAVQLNWIPVIGVQDENVSGFQALAAPLLTMVIGGSALTTRTTRSSMLEIMGEDFIRTARAKGLSEKAVLFKHALRNAAIPIATVVGYNLAASFGGAIIVETVFSRPGIGKLLIDAVNSRDYPVIQGTTVFIAFMLVFVNLLTDILYSIIDPRIRVQNKK